MVSPPAGTVTFLFTDIEGSTTLAQQHPAEWEAARLSHHAILNTAADAHGGFVFQIVGDAFCIAFATVSDALAAALAAQHELQRMKAEGGRMKDGASDDSVFRSSFILPPSSLLFRLFDARSIR